MKNQQASKSVFTSYQKFIVAMLAFLQFTIILDFMILSPLGAILMPALDISAKQFGWVVSVYAFSAGTSGILAAGFADRFDRKKLLLFFYTGFVLGTLFCGLAPNYYFLLAARMITGIFGGVIGSIVGAITTDLFPLNMRGRVMGFIQTAFATSQILGLPAGLYFANLWGWHAPFIMIVAISIIAGLLILYKMEPMNGHLSEATEKNAFRHLKTTVNNKKYLFAFASTALLSIGGFMMMPFSSAFTVGNLGVSLHDLPLIYLVTGFSSILMGPVIGKISDKVGKYKVFVVGSLVSATTVLIYTNLGATPLAIVMLINVVMFTGIFSRMIPSQALMSAIPTQTSRGAFMSISMSLQQMAGGLAAIVAGMIVVLRPDGVLEHFDVVGYVMIGTVMITVVMMYFINKSVGEQISDSPPTDVATVASH
jgi:predicted MFS family arabinose efflux permease